jgi:hypothetical protein
VQTPTRNDKVGSSTQGSGFANIVQRSSEYTPILPGQPGFQSPHSQYETQHDSPHMSAMLEFMCNFGTPSPAQVASLLVDVSIPDVTPGETQNGVAGVPHDAEASHDLHAEDPTTQELCPDQLLLISKYIFFFKKINYM